MDEHITNHGILLLYHHPWSKNASTIMEHVSSFAKYSRFKVWEINTARGFHQGLNQLKFDTIVLHYSLFGPQYLLNQGFLNYLAKNKSSYKIAFFHNNLS